MKFTNSQTAEKLRDRYEESTILKVVAWVLFIGLLAALAWVSWVNIAPYTALVEQMSGVLVDPQQDWLGQLITSLGSINSLASVAVVVRILVGVLIWAVNQIFQVLWILISLDRQAMRGAAKIARESRFKVHNEDDRATQRIARKYNRIPYFFMRWAGILALGSYTFDLIVGSSLYPPAENIWKFFFAFTTGLWGLIDKVNLVKLLIMMFSFELILILVIVVGQWIWTRQQEEAEAL